jgi:hypothetical protein
MRLPTMNRALLLLGLYTAAALGQSTEEQRHAERRALMEKRFALEKRIQATEPKRRDGPLRYKNISDDEAREVKSVAHKILPRAIVNIGPVVTGCPCEEGPECTDQVWITVDRGETSTGLLLSRTAGAWSIGPIQRWWFEKEDLEKRRSSFRSGYLDAEDALIDRFPACSSVAIEAMEQDR